MLGKLDPLHWTRREPEAKIRSSKNSYSSFFFRALISRWDTNFTWNTVYFYLQFLQFYFWTRWCVTIWSQMNFRFKNQKNPYLCYYITEKHNPFSKNYVIQTNLFHYISNKTENMNLNYKLKNWKLQISLRSKKEKFNACVKQFMVCFQMNKYGFFWLLKQKFVEDQVVINRYIKVCAKNWNKNFEKILKYVTDVWKYLTWVLF